MEPYTLHLPSFSTQFCVSLVPEPTHKKQNAPKCECGSKNTVYSKDNHGKYWRCRDCKKVKSL